MKITDKLLKKYANVSPLLPPASEEEVVEVEVPVTPNETGDKWLKLLQEAEGMDPLTEKPAQTEEELLSSLTESAPPAYEQELLKVLRPEHGVAGEDQPTIRPGKKANLSTDALLKMCSQYHDMCHKL
jgi:hypothetical protein